MIRYIVAFLIVFAAATAMADRPKNNLLPADTRHSMNFVSLQTGNDLAPGVDPATAQPAYSAPPTVVYRDAAGCSGSSSGCSGSHAAGCSGSSNAASSGRRLFGRLRLFRARGCS